MSPSVPEFGTPGQKDLFLSTWPKQQNNKKLGQLGAYNIGSKICWGGEFIFSSMDTGEYFPVFLTSNFNVPV